MMSDPDPDKGQLQPDPQHCLVRTLCNSIMGVKQQLKNTSTAAGRSRT